MKSRWRHRTSPVFAALVAVVNTKFPELGELVLKRVILQFRRAFAHISRCALSSRFLAHLINQQVVHELLALELLTVCSLRRPTIASRWRSSSSRSVRAAELTRRVCMASERFRVFMRVTL